MLRSIVRKSRWCLALVQVALLLVTSVTPAIAATNPPSLNDPQLLSIMQTYGIVKGDPTGNLNLDKPITRAEMITIMVRARNAEEEAKLYKASNPFSDARGHWAEANIAYASVKHMVKGDGNGLVRPDDMITYAEALTLLVRLVDKEPTTGEWPLNVLLASASLQINPPDVNVGLMREPAVRGLVFISLAKAISTILNDQGKTFLQSNIDFTPPTLVLDAVPASTKNASTRISGTARDAGSVSVSVNGKPASLIGNNFAADVSLDYGPNKVLVVAVDLAGNRATSELTVTRIPPIASLDITGPSKVKPGGTATYIVSAKDSNGVATSLTGLTVKVEGSIGSFDLQTGILTTPTTPAKGKITVSAGSVVNSIDVEVMGKDQNAARLMIRSINDGTAVSFTKPMTVMVDVQDINGSLLDNDYGRPVTLTGSGVTGLNISPTTAYTEGGVATFTVRAASMGFAALVASSNSLSYDTRTAEFGSTLRIRLSATPSTLTIGGSTTQSVVTATLVDENGTAVTNQSGTDIGIQLTFTGGTGTLVDSFIRIARGSSSSSITGDNGLFAVGTIASTVRVIGTLTTGQNITVDPTAITTTIPSVGSGTFWDLLGNNYQTPGTTSNLLVRLSNATGSTVQGSYAFQIGLSTSNNDLKTDGIPAGVTIWIGETLITNANTVLRTSNGVAPIKIKYTNPGQVYLTINPAAASSTALASDGTTGNAVNAGVVARTFTLTYSGVASGIKLVVDSEGLGNGNSVGAVPATAGKVFTLRALLTDGTNWVPGTTATVTLSRVTPGSSTVTPSFLTANATDGKATFTVTSTATPGSDLYQVSAVFNGNTVPSNPVTLQVQNAVPAAPTIYAVRGVNNGIPGTLNYLAPSDTGMEVELSQNTTQKWVVAKVYAENNSTLLYTSTPIDLSAPAPLLTIPKSVLPTGMVRYQISVRNGFGDSGKSLSSNAVTNAVSVTNIGISDVKLQRSTNVLTITGSGFATTGVVNPALITISDASTNTSRTLEGALVTITSSNQITLNLTGIPSSSLADILNPALFSGNDVTVTTAATWYTRANGEQSAAITTGAPVSPMANIHHVVYDRVNSRLYLVGVGFTNVTLNMSKLKLQATGKTDIVLSTFSSSRLDDTQWVVNLSSSAVASLDANTDYKLNALDGWASVSSWTQPALSDISLYGKVALASVTYNVTANVHKLTLTGSGFTGGDVTIGLLQVTDLSTSSHVTLTGTYSIISDSQIEFVLNSTAYADLENQTKFQGTDIYLTASPSWFINAAGRPAAEIPLQTLRLRLAP